MRGPSDWQVILALEISELSSPRAEGLAPLQGLTLQFGSRSLDHGRSLCEGGSRRSGSTAFPQALQYIRIQKNPITVAELGKGNDDHP